MKRKLLAVKPTGLNYLSDYSVSVAASYEKAKNIIVREERRGVPFDELDLNVQNEKEFYEFVRWMEMTDRRYSFSIFGYRSKARFMRIAADARERGFHFNS